jgi:hypothetical protein
VHIEWALRQAGIDGRPITFNVAAEKLNERRLECSNGGRWQGHQLKMMARRIGINHPDKMVPDEAVKARVHEICIQHPEFTGAQIRRNLGFARPVGMMRVLSFAKESRRVLGARNRMQRTVGWAIDTRTPLRIKASTIWKKHPELTAKQVFTELGPDFPHTVDWVRRLLRDCRRAAKCARRRGVAGFRRAHIFTPERPRFSGKSSNPRG